MKLRLTLSLILLLFIAACNPIEKAYDYSWSREAPVEERMVVIETSQMNPQVQFAVGEILSALQEKGYPAKLLLDNAKGKYRNNRRISLQIDAAAGLNPEGFLLTVSVNDKGNPQFALTAVDSSGAMYGGLHMAEAVRIEQNLLDIQEAREEPYLAQRGLKINIPLAAQTSGSEGAGDAAVNNYAEMLTFDFWTEFLDTMALYRYNTVMLRATDGGKGIRENTGLWGKVVRYAKDRGIGTYVLLSVPRGEDLDSRNLPDSMRQLSQLFPDLAGVGVQAAEDKGDAGRIMEAGKEHSDWTFRYSRDRLYSSPAPPFYAEILESMRSNGVKCWWDLENGDIFVHRWGDPDYVRAYLTNFPLDQTAGYFAGSDGYVLGREFISIDYTKTRPLEIVKHWYCVMLWGRLGYNPNLDRNFFEKVLRYKFPTADPALLYDAWQTSSKIIPLVDRFHWRDWDSMWQAEGCMDSEGFCTIQDFIDPAYGTMEGSGLASIPDTVSVVMNGQVMGGSGPVQTADQLDGLADRALEISASIRLSSKMPAELSDTVEDVEAMALLGKYYAAKIRGAFEYAMFKASGQAPLHKSAVQHLINAAEYWRDYARKDTTRYKTLVLARTGLLDWWQTWEKVKEEAEAVQKEKPAGTVVTFGDRQAAR